MKEEAMGSLRSMRLSRPTHLEDPEIKRRKIGEPAWHNLSQCHTYFELQFGYYGELNSLEAVKCHDKKRTQNIAEQNLTSTLLKYY